MPAGLPNVIATRPAPKPWWRSRTLLVNAAVLALAAAETQLQVLQPLLPVNVYSLIAFGLPVVNALLRVITVQPLTGERGQRPADAAPSNWIDTLSTGGDANPYGEHR